MLVEQLTSGMSQRGYGVGGVFRSAGRYVSPILSEVGKIAATTGAKLAENLISDAIEGKDLKESARERGKEAGKQSLNLGTKRVIQQVQGRKAAPKATPKRPRSQSGGPKRKKSKKSQKGGKRKRSQKGGAKSKSKKKRKTVGVVFPRAMTQKQRRSLPPKDIFG